MRDWRRGLFDCMGGVADHVGGNANGPYPYWSDEAGEFTGTPEPEVDPETLPETIQKRDDMLALIDKWMPTSILAPKIPPGHDKDLLALCGWDVAKGKYFETLKKQGIKYATSCGDVLAKLLYMWGSEFAAAFNIRDTGVPPSRPGAVKLGYYVKATGKNRPNRGDIVVLRNGPGAPGDDPNGVGHVGVLVSIEDGFWSTADGGGGVIPDQTATVARRPVEFNAAGVAILTSPTDRKKKLLDGWVNLRLIPRGAPNPSGIVPKP